MPWMSSIASTSICQSPDYLAKMAEILKCTSPAEKCPLNITLSDVCPRTHFCNRDMYEFIENVPKERNDNRSTLKLIIDNDYVVYVEDAESYDFQSFFGEVGGTLGQCYQISENEFCMRKAAHTGCPNNNYIFLKAQCSYKNDSISKNVSLLRQQ